MYGVNITRPDVFKPDQFQISVDESMLLWLEEGVQGRIASLYDSVQRHQYCNLGDEGGCLLRKQWMLERYGSLQEAFEHGCRLTDCTEDLMWLYGELSRLMGFLHQARYLRTNPTERSATGMEEAVAKLRDIKQQERLDSTGQYPTVKPKSTDGRDEAQHEQLQEDVEVDAVEERKSRARQRFEQKQPA